MSEKIRIWHVIETLDTGGAENILVDIVNNLDIKYDVTICCLKKSGVVASKISRNGTKIIELNKKEGNDYSIPFKMAKMIKENNVRIIHSHNWGVFCESALAARLGGADIFIHTVHGDFHPHEEGYIGFWKGKIRHSIERCFAAWVDAIVAVSEDVRKVIHEKTKISLTRIRVIRNGVQLRAVDGNKRDEIIREYYIDEKDFVIIAVGRLVPVKNIPCLVEAIDILKKSILNLKVLIIGEGPERNNVYKMIKLLLLEKLVFLVGERKDIPELLSLANIYVLPSKHEGISISLLEAMGAGLPIIATSVGGNTEVLENGKSGILVPCNDPKILAGAILELYNNVEERTRLGEGAREKVNKEFTLERMIIEYEKLYLRFADK